LSEQVQPGTFEFALDHLVDRELDVSGLDARFNNDETGAGAYDPRVMLKIVLLAYSRGLVSSRSIPARLRAERAVHGLEWGCPTQLHPHCQFVRELGEQIKPLFAQVLLTCDLDRLDAKECEAIKDFRLQPAQVKRLNEQQGRD
jgi:hypothetical protein